MDHFDQFIMNQAICCNQLFLIRRIFVTIHVSHFSASFFNNKITGCGIPCAKAVFKKTFEPSGSNPAKIDRSAAKPADGDPLADETLKNPLPGNYALTPSFC
jgi:hypothetical protein